MKNVFDLTEKDLFRMKLRGEPIVIDVSHRTRRWAEKEDIEHLKNIGALRCVEGSDDYVLNHHIVSLIDLGHGGEPTSTYFKAGTRVSSARKNDK